jgi:hypothetical protein
MKFFAAKSFRVGCLLLLLFDAVVNAAPAAKYIPQDQAQPVSPLKVAAFDFLLPGYGTYTQGQTGFAAAYFSANITNLVLIYVAYRNWRFYESAYRAAAVRQALEPDKLSFQDPAGGDGYMSLQDIKNRAERGQLFFALSIIVNVAIRGVSAWHSWSLADEAVTKAGPRYEFYPEANGGMRAQAGYYFNF